MWPQNPPDVSAMRLQCKMTAELKHFHSNHCVFTLLCSNIVPPAAFQCAPQKYAIRNNLAQGVGQKVRSLIFSQGKHIRCTTSISVTYSCPKLHKNDQWLHHPPGASTLHIVACEWIWRDILEKCPSHFWEWRVFQHFQSFQSWSSSQRPETTTRWIRTEARMSTSTLKFTFCWLSNTDPRFHLLQQLLQAGASWRSGTLMCSRHMHAQTKLAHQKSERSKSFTLKTQGSQRQLFRNGFGIGKATSIICKVTIPVSRLDENDQKHTLDLV